MSKVITDKEASGIISEIINGDNFSQDQYIAFLRDIGTLIANHCGGYFKNISTPDYPGDDTSYCLHFEWDESVPEGGGVFKNLDTDVSMEEWISDAREGKNTATR